MEERKNTGRLSYDELNRALSDLHIQYQKLTAKYREALEALQDKDFNMMSFFLQALFKVMERPDMYDKEFVSWASENIQSALVSFAEGMKPSGDEKKKDGTDGKKEGAEASK